MSKPNKPYNSCSKKPTVSFASLHFPPLDIISCFIGHDGGMPAPALAWMLPLVDLVFLPIDYFIELANSTCFEVFGECYGLFASADIDATGKTSELDGESGE